MAVTLDTRRIRSSTKAELRDYYKQLLSDASAEPVTAQLLDAVGRGSIPPSTFAPWLNLSKSPAAIREALTQDKSVKVRNLGITQLHKALSSPQWQENWTVVGGVAGLLEIFADLSVIEVREACKAIGSCGRGDDLEEKRKQFTEFFKGLHPELFPDALHRTRDRRLLDKHYRYLMPACSEELIAEVIAKSQQEGWKEAHRRYLIKYHTKTLQREFLRLLRSDKPPTIDKKLLAGLLHHYPTAKAYIRGFSESMMFSLEVLKTLANSGRDNVEDDFFVDQLVGPLLGRAIKKHADWTKIQETVDLTVLYLETHPSAGRKITVAEGSIFHQVAICWSHMPELFEKQLRRLLSHPDFGTSKKDHLTDWEVFLSGISAKRTYSLLRLCYQESTGLDLDIDADLAKSKGSLQTSLLSSLSHGEALSLFSRLRTVRDNTEASLVSGHTLSLLGSDVELHHIWLLSRNNFNDQAREIAIPHMDVHKKKAASAPEPEQRTSYAKSVLSAAVASGSLEILKEALEWVKRFIRDPLVFRKVYSSWHTHDAVRLLSGVPEFIDGSFNLPQLAERVKFSNSILASIFDTACAVLLEPSFSMRVWIDMFAIFYNVVKERMDCTPILKRHLNAQDTEVYTCLWEDTIDMLVAVEEKANKVGHEKLHANLLGGILAFPHPSNIEIEIADDSSYQFVNSLAQARNELWCKIRASTYPAVITLPKPLPRGLPIQYLTTPWKFVSHHSLEKMTYVASRVHDVLFPDPATVIQVASTDEEFEKAIGICVDSYASAVELYIPKRCIKTERLERVKSVWDYATGPLSRHRMSESEAVRFWEHAAPGNLKEWPTPDRLDRAHEIWPLIPEGNDHHEPCEWNPLTSRRSDDLGRDFDEIALLDLSLKVPTGTYDPTVHKRMEIEPSEVPGRITVLSTIWSPSRNIGEGGVLSALLYLDAQYVKTNRLLAKPFVSDVDVRYPAMYLDDAFLDSDIPDPSSAARHIRGHLDAIPPALLEQLTHSLIEALDTADLDKATYSTLHEVALNLVIRLGESDRPSLATPLAIRIILDRPKSSSWHRQLLKKGFLQKISASEARSCIEAFINTTMQIVASKEKSKELEKSQEDRPYIKVTTIKFLIKLLQELEYVGVDYALSKLSALSKENRHSDICLTIVKSVLSLPILESPQYWDQTLALLESVIPFAGALDERAPMDEAKWLHSEQNLALPEFPRGVTGEAGLGHSWILRVLLNYFIHGKNSDDRMQQFLDRIIFPTFQSLKDQTMRWRTLFLRKYGNQQDAQEEIDFPSVPLALRLLTGSGNRFHHVPRAILEEYVALVHFNISPPEPIRALNRKLRADKALSSLAEVQTWLNLYGREINGVPSIIMPLLDHAGNDTPITPRVIQEGFLKLFTAVLWNDTPAYTKLTGNLCGAILDPRCLTKPWWAASGKPIVEAMIAYVDSLRTREWERDPDRAPSVLPNTFPWRLLTLDYPLPSREDTDADSELKSETFAKQLSAIVDEMSGLGVYHHRLEDLRTYLNANFAPPNISGGSSDYNPLRDALAKNRILTAIHLGDLSKMRLSWVTSPEVLRCEIAAILVEKVGRDVQPEKKIIREDVRQRLLAMLASWKSCENEQLRRRGWQLANCYFG
ncbi:hypothetical protein PTT_16408 [Pyrenophora teres f. teres 0-1]|uniref:Uncharacterized protein n=1 Tax=Pyrenophora teres f. teres (strain 0-1) TaxID=861557 RepID=E3S294_PYRTT|nr:hypothetical protein PTT_16408 [Pyrenophora teres f. teres 0-1]KAE8837947.1 hypothetical protein PTNB85_05282 [Pyrenophora teres f. teres]